MLKRKIESTDYSHNNNNNNKKLCLDKTSTLKDTMQDNMQEDIVNYSFDYQIHYSPEQANLILSETMSKCKLDFNIKVYDMLYKVEKTLYDKIKRILWKNYINSSLYKHYLAYLIANYNVIDQNIRNLLTCIFGINKNEIFYIQLMMLQDQSHSIYMYNYASDINININININIDNSSYAYVFLNVDYSKFEIRQRINLNESDICLVSQQCDCTYHDAILALIINNKDIVNAIMEITM